MNLHPEILLSLAVGLGLSACCGFRVFVPLFIASIASKLGWLPMSENFSWLSYWPTLIAFGTASVAEILAYYIPVIDNLLDTIATPSAMLAGTLISASTFIHLDPTWQWILGIIVGGGSAGLIQAGTGIARLGSTKFTAGTGNGILSTGENTAAIGGSVLALVAPFIMAAIVLILILIIVFAVAKFFFHKKEQMTH